MRFFLPRISDLSEAQYRLLLFAQAAALNHAKGALLAPLDADVAEAAAAVAATLETAGKGIIYEHRAASMTAQRLAADLGRAVSDLTRKAGAEASRVERDMAVALRRLQRIAQEAGAAVPDSANAAGSWMALARRMMDGAGKML